MKKYEIWFGKDPEELPNGCWSDFAEDTAKFKNEEVIGQYVTDDAAAFWTMMVTIGKMPPSMWYWVWIDGNQVLSGAIDPDDLEGWGMVPDWAVDEARNTHISYTP